MISSCQPIEENLFSAENIRKCEQYILCMQKRLDKASRHVTID